MHPGQQIDVADSRQKCGELSMKNGQYSARLQCGDFQTSGPLLLNGEVARLSGPQCEVEGQIAQAGQRLVASFTIELAPGVTGNAFIGGIFACPMTGTGENDSFSLYGLGPLGLIVEITCQWSGEIEARSEAFSADRPAGHG
jgi:hypothetical protein